MKYYKILGFIVLILLVIIVTIFFLRERKVELEDSKATPNSTSEQTSDIQVVEQPIFSWRFEDSNEIDLDGLPRTNIYLEAKYSNNKTENQLIASAQGSCNELLDSKEDRLPNTEVVQCYAAGFGDRYKIIKGDSSYLIEHQEFQEASPDYDTPPGEYELISEFPFSLEEDERNTQQNIILKDGRQCYTYNQEATKDAPYAVTEFMDITIKGNEVNGTKKGTQSGPGMTNGYTGTLTGSVNEDMNSMTLVYSYTVEGSKNQEKEIYKTDKAGIEKLRYPLIQGKGMLVPDTTKNYKLLDYNRVGCEASN